MQNDLYTGKNAKHFSQSRNQPWEGWKLAFKYLKNLESLSVLDLGCGNGRYLDFLLSQNKKVEKYVGVDSSEELLEIAAEKYGGEIQRTPLTPLNQRGGVEKVKFVEHDLNNSINIKDKFNHIVLWAVLHHIESAERRLEIIKESVNHLEKDGIFAITFWQFGNNPDFLKRHTIKNLENNDYILSFGKEKSERFCHHFTDEEIDLIINKIGDVKVLGEFSSDGFNNNMNYYVILQKI